MKECSSIFVWRASNGSVFHHNEMKYNLKRHLKHFNAVLSNCHYATFDDNSSTKNIYFQHPQKQAKNELNIIGNNYSNCNNCPPFLPPPPSFNAASKCPPIINPSPCPPCPPCPCCCCCCLCSAPVSARKERNYGSEQESSSEYDLRKRLSSSKNEKNKGSLKKRSDDRRLSKTEGVGRKSKARSRSIVFEDGIEFLDQNNEKRRSNKETRVENEPEKLYNATDIANASKTPINLEEKKPKTPTNLEEKKPKTPTNLEEKKPKTPTNLEEKKPKTPKNTDDKKPRASKIADAKKPRASKVADAKKPRASKIADAKKPRASKAKTDKTPSKNPSKKSKSGAAKRSKTTVFELTAPFDDDFLPRSVYPKFNPANPYKFKTSDKFFDLSSSNRQKTMPFFYSKFSNTELNRLVYENFVKTHQNLPFSFGFSDKKNPAIVNHMIPYNQPFPTLLHSTSTPSISPYSSSDKSLQNFQSDSSICRKFREFEGSENLPNLPFDDERKNMKTVKFNDYYRNEFSGYEKEPFVNLRDLKRRQMFSPLQRKMPVWYDYEKQKRINRMNERIQKQNRKMKVFKNSKKCNKYPIRNIYEEETNYPLKLFHDRNIMMNHTHRQMKQKEHHNRRLNENLENIKRYQLSKYLHQSVDSIHSSETLKANTSTSAEDNVPSKVKLEINNFTKNILDIFNQLEMLNKKKKDFEKKFKDSQVIIRKYVEDNLPTLLDEVYFQKMFMEIGNSNNYVNNLQKEKFNAKKANRTGNMKPNETLSKKPFDFKNEPPFSSFVDSISTFSNQQELTNLQNNNDFNFGTKNIEADLFDNIISAKQQLSKNALSDGLGAMKNGSISPCLQQMMQKNGVLKKSPIPLPRQAKNNFGILNRHDKRDSLIGLKLKKSALRTKIHKPLHKRKVSLSKKPHHGVSRRLSKFRVRNCKKPSIPRLSKLPIKKLIMKSKNSLSNIIERMAQFDPSSLFTPTHQLMDDQNETSESKADLDDLFNPKISESDSLSTLLAKSIEDKDASLSRFYKML